MIISNACIYTHILTNIENLDHKHNMWIIKKIDKYYTTLILINKFILMKIILYKLPLLNSLTHLATTFSHYSLDSIGSVLTNVIKFSNNHVHYRVFSIKFLNLKQNDVLKYILTNINKNRGIMIIKCKFYHSTLIQ